MTTTPTIDGMSCGHCEQTVEDAIRDVDPAALVRAVEAAGYTTSV